MALCNVFNNTRCWLVPWKCDRWFNMGCRCMLGVWLASWISPYMQFHHDIYKPYSSLYLYLFETLLSSFHLFTPISIWLLSSFHLITLPVYFISKWFFSEFYAETRPYNWKPTPEQTRHLTNETVHHTKNHDH
jgi:hypothetical protein